MNMAANYHIIWSFSLMISFVFTFDSKTSLWHNEKRAPEAMIV